MPTHCDDELLSPPVRLARASAGVDTPGHVVVLAAGRGSRLGALGEETPKWLLEVGRRTLADRHLEATRAAAEAVASVSVVAGHALPAIRDMLSARPEEVRVVANPEFATRNNWWSLLLALRELPADGPVIVLNADLLIDARDAAAFLRAAACADADGLVAVDRERRLTDESMKVALAADGTLAAIGKEGIDQPVGEYIGMLAARGSVLRALRSVLEGFVGHADAADEWYEGAVGRTAAAGVAWRLWAMPTTRWVEIDDDDDLTTANALVDGAR